MTVLVTAASRHGATAEITQRIADVLADRGVPAEYRELDKAMDVSGYDAVVFGAAIYAGSWQRVAAQFVDLNAARLNALPVWAFSSGPVGDPLQPTEVPRQITSAVEKMGAREHRLFGGRVDRSNLAFFERQVLKALKVTDGDFRPWDDIDAWAAEIAGQLVDGDDRSDASGTSNA